MAGSGRIKGKQIVDDSVDINKLSSGIKLLPSDAKLGINKTPAQITDPKEYVTLEYVDSISDDVDAETIILDGNILKVNIKTPIDTDEIGIISDGVNGIHLNKIDISSTISGGLGLDETTDIDGVKTFDVKALNSPVGRELNVHFGSSGDLVIDIDELSNTFLNKVETTTQTVISDVYFDGGDITFDSVSTTKTKDSFVNDQELVSKGYVDSVAQGLDWKESVLIASDIDLNTGWTYNIDPSGSSDGWLDTLSFTGTISNTDIDSGSSVSLAIGDRILIKEQTDSTQNGIYVLTTIDTLTRAEDQNGSDIDNISSGNSVFIEQGTYQNTGWVLQGNGTLTPNTDTLEWIQFSGSGQLIAGTGIIKTSDTIGVDLASNSGLRFDVGGDGGKLLIDTKTPSSTDVAIQITGGVHILKSDISSTITSGNAIDESVDSDGIKTLSVNSTDLAGNGIISVTGDDLSVNVDDSTIEIASDVLQVKADGLNNTHLDYGTGVNQINASVIPSDVFAWSGSATNGDNIQGILEALDSDIQSVGGSTTASNGLSKVTNDIQLGGLLTSDVTINGNTGSNALTINEVSILTLSTNSGGSLVMNTTDTIFTDSTVDQQGIKYALDYSSTYSDRSLVDKQYVDIQVANATTSGNTQWDTIELTGFTTSSNTGQVSYLGSLTFVDDAIDEAQVFINGLRLDVPTQAYFDTVGNTTPSVGSTLFFDLNALGYEIETDDCIVVTYLVEV